MDHHCRDLRQALHGRCEIDIRSCGKKWEQFNEVVASIGRTYDRVYVAGELLAQYVYKAVAEPQRFKLLIGVHSFFLWDHGSSVGTNVARGSQNPQFLSALRPFSAVAVICESLRAAFPEIDPHLTHYGVNTEIFHPAARRRPEPRRLRVGWVGVLLKHKNHGLFLEIRERLAGVADCVDVLVSPDGYYSADVLSRDGMNRFYNDLDVLVVTADSEGGPLPPLEASASGVPVITPAIGCMTEFVRHGIDGYVVDSYEAGEYVRLVRLLDNNREILRQMRDACIEKAFGPWNLKAKAEAWFEFLTSSGAASVA